MTPPHCMTCGHETEWPVRRCAHCADIHVPTFTDIIPRDQQYEVAKARAEIAWQCFIDSIVARNIPVLIDARFI